MIGATDLNGRSGYMYLEGSARISAEAMAAAVGRNRGDVELDDTAVRGRRAFLSRSDTHGPGFVQLAPGIVIAGGPPHAVVSAIEHLDRPDANQAAEELRPLLPQRDQGQVFAAIADEVVLRLLNETLAARNGKTRITVIGVKLDVGPAFDLRAELRCADGEHAAAAADALRNGWLSVIGQVREEGLQLLAKTMGELAFTAVDGAVLAKLSFDQKATRSMMPGLLAALPYLFLARAVDAPVAVAAAAAPPPAPPPLKWPPPNPDREILEEEPVLGVDVRQARARSDLAKIASAIELYYVKNAALPTDLLTLTEKDARGNAWLKELSRDPWGNAYRLIPGDKPRDFLVASDGPDGKTGTADDIKNTDKLANDKGR
jgi:hypothetical protein